jgi:hypothetical protein
VAGSGGLGAVFTAAVTLVGLLLKHSIDRRTVKLTLRTDERLQQESRERHDRLRVDTVIRAVELLATKEGKGRGPKPWYSSPRTAPVDGGSHGLDRSR